MDSTTRSKIELLINSKPIFVFMKGNKLMPQCGFSNNVVQILNSLGMSFDTFDVLSDMEIKFEKVLKNIQIGRQFLKFI